MHRFTTLTHGHGASGQSGGSETTYPMPFLARRAFQDAAEALPDQVHLALDQLRREPHGRHSSKTFLYRSRGSLRLFAPFLLYCPTSGRRVPSDLDEVLVLSCAFLPISADAQSSYLVSWYLFPTSLCWVLAFANDMVSDPGKCAEDGPTEWTHVSCVEVDCTHTFFSRTSHVGLSGPVIGK